MPIPAADTDLDQAEGAFDGTPGNEETVPDCFGSTAAVAGCVALRGAAGSRGGGIHPVELPDGGRFLRET